LAPTDGGKEARTKDAVLARIWGVRSTGKSAEEEDMRGEALLTWLKRKHLTLDRTIKTYVDSLCPRIPTEKPPKWKGK
jgi:hypothetical protein